MDAATWSALHENKNGLFRQDTGHSYRWKIDLALDGKVLLATHSVARAPGACTECKTAVMTMRRKKATPLDERKYKGRSRKVKHRCALSRCALSAWTGVVMSG
jgi:hypothetical protein